MKLSLVERAVRIALAAHEGQTRKGEDVPYITHPLTVGIRLAQEGFSEEIIAAAIVHDVVEDTPVTLEEIRSELGEEVASIVEGVSHDDSLSWEEKKEKYAESIRVGSEGVKAVALMDKIHNAEYLLNSYDELGTEVWARFKRGKEKKIWFEEMMLSVFKETWDHPLVEYYETLIQKLKDAV